MELFSPAWFASLAAGLAALEPEPGAPRISLGQIVTAAPGGEVAYTITVGGGEPAGLEVGSTATATVTLVEDYVTARAVASGTPIAELLHAGAIKVRGDVRELLAANSLLADLASGAAAL